MIADAVKTARGRIEAAHTQYAQQWDGNMVGLEASQWNEDRVQVGRVPLLLEWDDIRDGLKKQNRHLLNLKKRYVTSRIAESAD